MLSAPRRHIEAATLCAACHYETSELPAGLVAIRFHDLMHSAVSRMIAAGVPLPIIAKIVDGQQERWRIWQRDTVTSAWKNLRNAVGGDHAIE